MKFRLLLAFLLFFLTVKAQTAVTTITPAHLKAAEDLLTSSGASAQLKGNIAAMINQSSANVPADKKEKFVGIMNAFMNKYLNWDLIKDQMAAMYAQEFTEQELKDLSTFYQSPLGKKMNQKQPVLFQKGAQIGQMAVQSHQSELQQMMQDAFKTP
jgi:hypothetical protein